MSRVCVCGAQGQVLSLAIASSALVSGGQDNTIRVWNFNQQAQIFMSQAIISQEDGGHYTSVHALCVMGNVMFSADRAGNIVVRAGVRPSRGEVAGLRLALRRLAALAWPSRQPCVALLQCLFAWASSIRVVGAVCMRSCSQAWDLASGKAVQRLDGAHGDQPIMSLLAFEVRGASSSS